MIALGGSSFYGPRRAGEFRSDIDVNFLLEQPGDELNFNIFPGVIKSDQHPFHYYGTGYSDNARGRRAMHWLLYPHYPIYNEFPMERMREIISALVVDTKHRQSEIEKEIQALDEIIKKESQSDARAWKK